MTRGCSLARVGVLALQIIIMGGQSFADEAREARWRDG